ncbi:hypothetical protein V5O48_019046 [Marasmius crinis-equi]|uniref:Ricin B lectin domain-containing protein n=1 Tax=Marasmius crinis-equi TaxID=585013 RepID=A0ABR3EJG9_9AGAR
MTRGRRVPPNKPSNNISQSYGTVSAVPSGVYYIKNIKTGHWLSIGDISSGEKVSTEKSTPTVRFFLLDDLPTFKSNLQIFHIFDSNGVNQITDRGTGLSVGSEVLPSSGTSRNLIWQRSAYTWTIQQVSPGIWNIGNPIENAYWSHSAHLGQHVTLGQGSADDGNNWQLIAVAD